METEIFEIVDKIAENKAIRLVSNLVVSIENYTNHKIIYDSIIPEKSLKPKKEKKEKKE